MADRKALEGVFHQRGYTDFKWIDPQDIVVAEWVRKPVQYGQGLATCTELFVISGPPDHNPKDLPEMDWVVNRCRPIWDYFDEHRAEVVAAEYERVIRSAAGDEERSELVKQFKKKGDPLAAAQLEHGGSTHIGQAEGGEALAEMAEDLSGLASGRMISTGGKERKPRHKF